MRLFVLLMAVSAALTINACSRPALYDLVINNGRAIDPESGLDGIRNIAISEGRILKISKKPLSGRKEIEAAGLIAAPGFIDIHSHSPTPLGARYQLLDGVTTQLDLEAGAFPVREYGFMFAQGTAINYGSSVSHLAARIQVMESKTYPYLFNKNGAYSPDAAMTTRANPAQIERMRGLLSKGLDDGGLGIGVLLDYISGAVSSDELRMIFEVATAHKAPVAVHVRRGLPGDTAGLTEVIALAEETGAALLICHITHSAMHAAAKWLSLIDAANTRGANITTETLSFAAGGTAIGADVFTRDWQKIFNISYADVQWTATGEWLTEDTFKKHQRENPGGMINHHYVKEAWMETVLRWPRAMVSSDVTPAFDSNVMTNPNIAGTFARFLGHYVRDRNLVPLPEALAKTSLYQAQWLEGFAPAFAKKGRLQVGMDADITIFDPEKIAARADYGDPYQASAGINYVINGGVIVAENGKLTGANPGQRILATASPK